MQHLSYFQHTDTSCAAADSRGRLTRPRASPSACLMLTHRGRTLENYSQIMMGILRHDERKSKSEASSSESKVFSDSGNGSYQPAIPRGGNDLQRHSCRPSFSSISSLTSCFPPERQESAASHYRQEKSDEHIRLIHQLTTDI